MFFSWCFLLLVASTGFWGTQSVLAESSSEEFRSAPVQINSRSFGDGFSGGYSKGMDDHTKEIWDIYKNHKGGGYLNVLTNNDQNDGGKHRIFCLPNHKNGFGPIFPNDESWERFARAIVRYMNSLLNFKEEDQLQMKRAEVTKDDIQLKIKQAEAEINKLEASLKGSA